YREVRALAAGGDLARLEARLAADPAGAFTEKVLNALGYRALYGERDVARAVRLFELATRTFPESGNVWDSLGEALAERGDVAAASASYERSLALAPDNDNARRQLARLRAR
ncbi:MAG: tetratricopeptide repeat protein, partial [Thermoanaerobaculia bacterium]